MLKKIALNQIPVSNERLCQYGDIGENDCLREPYERANFQAEYGISFDEWLVHTEGSNQLVEQAWNELSAERQLFIVIELHSDALRSLEMYLNCIKAMAT